MKSDFRNSSGSGAPEARGKEQDPPRQEEARWVDGPGYGVFKKIFYDDYARHVHFRLARNHQQEALDKLDKLVDHILAAHPGYHVDLEVRICKSGV